MCEKLRKFHWIAVGNFFNSFIYKRGLLSSLYNTFFFIYNPSFNGELYCVVIPSVLTSKTNLSILLYDYIFCFLLFSLSLSPSFLLTDKWSSYELRESCSEEQKLKTLLRGIKERFFESLTFFSKLLFSIIIISIEAWKICFNEMKWKKIYCFNLDYCCIERLIFNLCLLHERRKKSDVVLGQLNK